jgi:MoaA/NifB/PqqE/SkfB family radical SAM enzyme
MRTRILRSEEIGNGVVITLEESEKSFLLKIKYLSTSLTVGRYRKDRAEALANVQFAFERAKEKLKGSIERGVKFVTVQFI